jgi:hypothetical protein
MSPIYVPGKVTLRQTSSTWAEGGDLVYTIVVSGTTYRVHEFKTTGTSSLNVLSGGSFQYLIIGGGSGGHGGQSGISFSPGGAAGVARNGSYLAIANSYAVIVGAGGTGITTSGPSNAGGSSSIFGFTATGGSSVLQNSRTGAANADYIGATVTTSFISGGGAGAGASAVGTVGGAGFSSDITGATVIRGGGGGGGGVSDQTGGTGGGGTGVITSEKAGSGQPNTGSGGGGGGSVGGGGNGGSGIVIVRYAI